MLLSQALRKSGAQACAVEALRDPVRGPAQPALTAIREWSHPRGDREQQRIVSLSDDSVKRIIDASFRVLQGGACSRAKNMSIDKQRRKLLTPRSSETANVNPMVDMRQPLPWLPCRLPKAGPQSNSGSIGLGKASGLEQWERMRSGSARPAVSGLRPLPSLTRAQREVRCGPSA